MEPYAERFSIKSTSYRLFVLFFLQSTTSSFLSASTSEASHPFAFKEVMYKLNNLRDDQMKEIQNITDVCHCLTVIYRI